MIFPPVLLRIAGLPASALTVLNHLPVSDNEISEEDWEILYRKAIVDLCQIANTPNLRNGLQMTSHSLAGRVEKILHQLPPTLRKKEKQTARSLWQIVSRMAGKTSPFSSFTHLGRVDENENNPGKIIHRFRLNNLLLGQLLEMLRYHPPYFKKQKLTLNYTVGQTETDYVFLHNTRNVESVQRIERQPVIDLMLTIFQKKKTFVFQDLVNLILREVAAEETEISAYIFSLAEYGLLVWELPVTPSTDNWWISLAGKLRQLPEDALCQSLAKLLTDTEVMLKTMATNTSTERAVIQQKYFYFFKEIWEANKQTLPSADTGQILEKGLQQISNNTFLIKPETLFYEDTRLTVKDFWTENNWWPLREKLTTLSRLLKPLTTSDRSQRLLDFYTKNFEEPVSLWTFYQKWLPVARDPREAENTGNQKIKLNLNDRLATLPRSASLVHLTPGFLRSLSPETVSSQNVGSLVMPFRDQGKDQLFLDTFVAANARLTGRFLPLFPVADTTAWRTFHQSQASGKLWIENQDPSFFNANVHPPLLSATLQIPSLAIAGKQNGIPITELIIQPDQKRKRLILTHQNRPVEVRNLSLEATDNRSGLYQLLCQLEPTVPSKNNLLQAINYRQPPTDAGLIKYPRVVYDQQITLQRATWFFSKQLIPIKQKGSTHTAYLQQLQNWQQKNNLPPQFYYTLNFAQRTTNTKQKNNQHKPQFFDLRNPLSVDLWHRDLKKVTQYLKIEEVLPLPEQLVTVDGVVRMVETFLT